MLVGRNIAHRCAALASNWPSGAGAPECTLGAPESRPNSARTRTNPINFAQTTDFALLSISRNKPQPRGQLDGSIGARLGGLLEALRQIQSEAARTTPERRPPGALSEDRSTRQLMETIKASLRETERLILGEGEQEDLARKPEANQADHANQAARSSLMRYSTPNLLLSSNFEHILRQRDKVSGLFANKYRTGGEQTPKLN